MHYEPFPNKQPRKRRGRPAGTARVKQASTNRRLHGHEAERQQDTPSTEVKHASETRLNEEPVIQKRPKNQDFSPLSSFLQSIIHHDHTEIARIARELNVAENTVYRWMNGTSEPRAVYLKRLPDVFPEYRSEISALINQTVGYPVNTVTPVVREPGKDIYQKTIELATLSQDDETRFWQVTQAIFEHALNQLDEDREGLAITYARLMPPQYDGIHSLREVIMRGHSPWPEVMESKAFLGSTTLAGSAAVLQRFQSWNDIDGGRAPVEIDEHERSAAAIPITHGSLLAGVLIISSTKPDFFKDAHVCQAAMEYGLIMSIALTDHDFHPMSLIHLRPMPPLQWQREQLTKHYIDRIILYVRSHATPRREAEFWVQHTMELEFEEEARKMLEQEEFAATIDPNT